MSFLSRISTRILNTPLLVTPEYGAVVTSVLADRIGVEPLVADDVVQSYKRPNDRDHFNRRAGIMTVPIIGGLVHRGDGPEAASGLQSYTSMHNKLEALFADDTTRGILIDADTGGGEAAGLQELADWLPKMSKQAGKPVWWIANTTTGSAAYWLGSSAERMYAAQNARVGSIGVYWQHVDMSKAMERRGQVVSFIYAGDHKIDGNPFAPLPDDVRASIQTSVNKLYGDFVGAVASNRGLDEKVVRDTQARVYGPEDAYALGLIDGVGGYGEVLTAFTEYLNRPFVGYTSHGDSMTTKLIYDQEAVDRAKAEGIATNAGALKDAQDKIAANLTERTALLAAFAELAPDNKRVAMFVEALNDGATVALASKLAAKIETPKVEASAQGKTRTEADVDRIMSAHAPSISDTGGTEGELDPKAKRLAELKGSMTAYNKSKGFVA
jgi:signal peptide peptidase SppA